MVLKHFILPEMHSKATFFPPIMTPPNLPHGPSLPLPQDYQVGYTKRGGGGLIKVK